MGIGHCLFSDKHIIERNTPPHCVNLYVSEIFNECGLFHQHRIMNKINRIDILEGEYNFEKVKGFLNEIQLYDLI